MNLDLGFLENRHPETAQTAYTGARYYRTDSGVYLKDFGRGDSDDSAKLYSGQMLDFDGVDDYVDTGCELVDGDSYTIAVIFQPGDGNGANNYYGANGINIIGTHLDFWPRINNSNSYRDYTYTVIAGNYYRTIMAVDNVAKTIKMFVNGVLYKEVSYTGDTTELDYSFEIGKSAQDNAHYFDSFIGNVQIWNAAFDADDVAFDYLNCYQNLTADNRPDTSLTSANLKGHWPLIAGSGDVAYDWSGNGNHGTLTNFPTDDSQWSNADALDSPLAIQTALCEWGMGSNLLDYSADTPNWESITAATFGTAVELSVDSTVLLYPVIPDNTTTAHRVRQYNSTDIVENTVYTAKAIVKSVAATEYIGVRVSWYDSDWGALDDHTVVLHLTGAGSVHSSSADSCTVELIDGSTDEYLVIIIGTSPASASIVWFDYYLYDNTPAYDFAGNGSDVYGCVGIANLSVNEGAFVITKTIPATNALVPIRSWETAGQFKRDYSELNWNGRSFADCGNGADVNPISTVLIETVFSYLSHNGTQGYITSDSSSVVRLYPYYNRLFFNVHLADGSSAYIGIRNAGSKLVEGTLYHIVVAYSKTSQSLYGYLNGVSNIFSTHNPDTWQDLYDQDNHRSLGSNVQGIPDYSLLGQLPHFKMWADSEAQAIIDDDLDAWVAKRYAKAKAKYNL